MRKVCRHSKWLTSNDSCYPDGKYCVYLTPTERVVCWHTKYKYECNHDPCCSYIDGRNVVIKDREQELYRIDGKPLTDKDRHDDMMTCRLRNNPFELDYSKCALIIMDVWDKHHGTGSSLRVAQLVPAINEFANFLREKGCLIIHSPSDTMIYNPNNSRLKPEIRNARKLAIEARTKECSRKEYAYLGNRNFTWYFDKIVEITDEWPEESNPATGKHTKQNSAIEIKEGDAISGDMFETCISKVNAYEEILALTWNRPNLIFCGVHTNMCILTRPNAMRTMAKSGKSMWLVRDLTDAAIGGSTSGLTDYAAKIDGSGNKYRHQSYNHFEGTDLIIDWIGRNVGAETWASDIATGKPRFRFTGPFGDNPDRVWPRK